MSQGLLWGMIVSVGLLTFGMRFSLIALPERARLSPFVEQALRFVPVAVLSALIAPAIFLPDGSWNLSLSVPRIAAGILATLVAWRTKNAVLTIIVGMACLLLLKAVMPGQ